MPARCGCDRACGGDRRGGPTGPRCWPASWRWPASTSPSSSGAPARTSPARARAACLTHHRGLDQRGIADRFLSQGQVAQVAGFAWIPLDISDFPTRHNYGLAVAERHQRHPGRLGRRAGVRIYRGREVTGFARDDTGVDVEARRPVATGGLPRRVRRRGGLIRKAAGIEFPG